jgi:NAD(P)-dependent dehydrogenase (short-subunit alcohol dehydrogenase family)
MMDSQARFQNRVILITGAASGIGKMTALRFAREGGNVAVVDRDVDGAQEVQKNLERLGSKSIVIEADVQDPDECQRMIRETTERLGDLQVIFTNAGIGGGQVVQDMSIETWQRIIRTNLTGVFYTCKYAIPSLIKNPGSSIVTMSSSMAGWDTGLTAAAYMASKEGVTGLTKSLALQLARYGVRVNAVCPGVIETNLGQRSQAEKEAAYKRFAKRIPLRRVGQPEDVAAVVAFLASTDARHVTGSMLLVDGGQTLQSWSNAPETDAFPLNFDLEML